MPAVLIKQNLYPELRKLGLDQHALDKLNTDLNDRIAGINPADVVGMTLDHADNVVRWTMDASLGFPDLPQLLISTVHIPGSATNPGPLGPVESGSTFPGLGPIAEGGANGLVPILSAPAGQSLLTAAKISAGIRYGQASPAIVAIKRATAADLGGQLTRPQVLRSPIKRTAHGLADGTFHPPILIDTRPDWEKHPEMYRFPTGFPRTEQDKQLAIQTGTLIDNFKAKTDVVANQMASQVRDHLPGWRLPASDGINWNDKDARFGFLRGCDQAMSRADSEGRKIFADAIVAMGVEGGRFLAAARTQVFCHPAIFEEYWDGQIRQSIASGSGFINTSQTQQSSIVNTLKTQLSALDFTQQQADQAAQQAQRDQGRICGSFGDTSGVVGMIVTIAVAAILTIAAL